MRTVTYGGAVSLDGFLAGPAGEIDWLHFSKDVQQEMAAFWKDVDAILMGRKTYGVAAGTPIATRRARSRRRSRSGRRSAARRRSPRCAPMSSHVP